MLSFSFATVATLLGAAVSASAQSFPPGVIATGTQGVTNPPVPTLGTAINQSSMARLLSVNSVDDFCLFAPPTLQNISDSETIEVAWCTKARNNARIIPDGVITGVSIVKNDFYVQLIGYGDLTKLNIPAGDFGGELDPHGAFGAGNPIGGNVTSNITGSDQNFAEWMLYIDYNQFCLRVCTNANSTYNAAQMCWHELDEMGCEFVMPGNYQVNNTFETCEADVAYPPGWYPTATVNGTPVFSTFAQRFTGTNADGSVYTVGDLTTPSSVAFIPSSSNCVTTSTIANGIALASLGLTGSATSSAASTATATNTTGTNKLTTSSTGKTSTTNSGTATSSGAPAETSGAAKGNAAGTNAQVYPMVTLISLVAGVAAVALFH